jgi:flagella basal body P-ring formation protein FlgA
MISRLPRFLLLAAVLASAPATATRAAQPPSQFTGLALAAGLTQAVSSHFNTDGELQIDLLRSWTAPVQTASSWQVVVTQFPTMISSTMLLRCQILADGVLVDEPSLMVRAQLWRDVWCSRQPLSSGTNFNPSDLETRRSDALRERNALPASVIDANMMLARDVPADRVLSWRDIARRTLVHKGEVVDVVAAEGQLSFTMKALALQNGTSGDFIVVRNMESLKDFSGEVVDAHRVQVHF